MDRLSKYPSHRGGSHVVVRRDVSRVGVQGGRNLAVTDATGHHMHCGTCLQCCSDVRVSQFVQDDPSPAGLSLDPDQEAKKRLQLDLQAIQLGRQVRG